MRVGRTAAVTDPGRRRLRNEDSYVCAPPLFAVTDGMGGAQAGELASRLAAAALEESERGVAGEQAVADLVRAANTRVYRHALEDPSTAGMGTTATVALMDAETGTVTIGHVGDSRAYRIREGRVEQLTADHSLVAELVRSGRLSPEEADEHPHRSVITRALGTEASVDVDTLTLEAAPGDLYLLCSDGLTRMVSDGEILGIAAGSARDPAHLARELVGAANRAGGEDNITVVVFEVEDGDPPPEAVAPVPAEPDEETAEAISEAADRPVQRRGAGHGGRALALAGVAVLVALAVLLIWWSVHR